MMRDQQWHRIEELYHAALERDPSQRAAFLQAECPGDDAVRREVESLLAEGEAEQFLTTPALELAGREIAASRDMLIGRQIGPYQIQSLLGVGGMGEVYRSRDTKLHRDVAIKVLPTAVAHDRDRVTRFAREARVLAALNHPHVAAIHGLEEANGILALVLELVEGETLADRIARGPIRTADAIAIAKQIVEGLESAHEKGIVHRDLKPANIKLRPDGNVKILDFGLAKALAPAHMDSHVSVSTGVSSVTQAGVVTGTPAYMSPEQAQGQGVDERTDIWAFGCVLYEMLTGRHAFPGQNTTETLAAVITAEPAWETLPREVSPSIRVFLKRCLSKDVRQRVSHINDMRLALEGAFETEIAATQPGRVTWRRAVALIAVAVVLMIITGLAVWTVGRPTTSAPPVARFSISLPTDQRFIAQNLAHVLAVSPDGMHVVYAAGRALWLQRLETLEPSVVRGTENSDAHTPFFSPDGQWIGYYAEASQQLKRVAVAGGSPTVIAATNRPFGATWPSEDLILYGRGADGIWQVTTANGKPGRIIAVAEGEAAHSPQVLPNGSVLFTLKPVGITSWDDAQIVVQARGSTKPEVVIQRGRDGRYLPTGHLVFASFDELMAVRFDAAAVRIVGNQVSLVPGVRGQAGSVTAATQFAVSGNGILIYVPGVATGTRTLVWVSKNGTEEPLNLEVRSFAWLRVSPDGKRIVVGNGTNELSLADISRPSWNPIAGPRNWYPIWSRDSNSIVYRSFPTDMLVRARADGSGVVELLRNWTENKLLSPGALTRDGRLLVFTYGTDIRPRLGLLHIDRIGLDKQPWEPLDRPYDMSSSSLSPDDDWIAYHSSHSGQLNVYIDRFPDLRDPKLISTRGGGGNPVWSADGREVFYRRLDGAMMSVSIDTTPMLTIGSPVRLFEWPQSVGGGGRGWDVAPDGRFLMVKENPSTKTASDSIVVVQNWFEELKRRLTN